MNPIVHGGWRSFAEEARISEEEDLLVVEGNVFVRSFLETQITVIKKNERRMKRQRTEKETDWQRS